MAAIRASYFREPGAVATVVPCQDLWPPGTLTKVEVLALRERSNGFDKYVPRADSWPKRVWDWPIPVPYRQGIRMRDMIWTGGQVPFEPGRNAGRVVLAGRLIPQTRFTMGYIEDILGGFGAVMSDLRLLVCYFTSTGTMTETEQFLAAVADCVPGVLPPITLVPQPHMHNSEIMLEIWGVARG
jgi:enamine deaminase RidA (YjgF/YER057c/UK114 family)